MIPKNISKHILTIGPDINAEGGIAILLKSYSEMFEEFNFIATTKTTNNTTKLLMLLKGLVELLYYFLFKPIKIVHVHTAERVSFVRKSIFIVISKLFNKKVILHMHGGDFIEYYNKNTKFCNAICRRVDSIVCVSKYFEVKYKEIHLNENIITIYNASKNPLYDKMPRNLDSKILNILFLGAINDAKGIFEIVDMWSKNKIEISSHFKLTICGIGQGDRLNTLIKEYELRDSINYKGWVNREEKEELLSKCDIYIQPSHFESFGIAILEAMHYGVPIIATNIGGIPELVEDETNGYLIAVGDMKAMRNSLIKLNNNRHILREFGDNSKIKSAKFSIANSEKNLKTLYNNILHNSIVS